MSKVINQKYMSFEEVVIESENEEDYKESLDTMRKAGFTRVKIYDNESMTMIPAVIYAAREVEKKERELFENRRSRSDERGYLKNR